MEIYGTTQRRPWEVFQKEEAAHLKPLPPESFERPLWKECTVHPDHHIVFDRSYYSLPTRFMGQKVWAGGGRHLVQIFLDAQLIKTHQRKVGIIANPASGKDIRRLVSYATVISNTEKTDIVKRVILGLNSTGVDEVLIMPDYYGLGIRALDALNHHPLSSKITILNFEIEGTQEDSIQAAQIMRESGVDCIVTLGGDGTNRVVSKTCGAVPLIPISTGTNNVFPVMNEGTTAGMTAGILARKVLDESKVTTIMKKLKLMEGGKEKDLALIDA